MKRLSTLFGRFCTLAFVAFTLAALSPAAEKDEATIRVMRGDMRITELHVEVADDLQEKLNGLMFRESLSSGHGMLFIYDPSENAHMWMKNTLIPLDMLFINSNQQIVHIHHKAEPHSLKPIGAGQMTSAVIEIAGGEAKARDIRVGDRILIERKNAE